MVKGVSTLEKRSPQVVLEPNEQYWNPARKPTVRIVFDNIIPKAEALKQVASKDGKIDLVTEVTPQEAQSIKRSQYARIVDAKNTKTVMVGVFNQMSDDSPWGNEKLRQAVNYAVNRPVLVHQVARGYGHIIPALISKGQFGYNPSLKPYSHDPAKATQLLKASGVKDDTITIVADEAHKPVADAVAAQLKSAGFNAVSKVGGPEGDWDIWLVEHFDWSPDFPIGVVHREFFGEDGAFRKTTAPEPQLQQMIARLFATPDIDMQERQIQAIERYIHDHANVLFLYSPDKLYAVRSGVHFVPYNSTVLELADTSVSKDLAAEKSKQGATAQTTAQE